MMEKSTVGTGEPGLRDMEWVPEAESDWKWGKGSAVVRKGEPRVEESKREKRGSAERKGGVMGDVGRIKE